MQWENKSYQRTFLFARVSHLFFLRILGHQVAFCGVGNISRAWQADNTRNWISGSHDFVPDVHLTLQRLGLSLFHRHLQASPLGTGSRKHHTSGWMRVQISCKKKIQDFLGERRRLLPTAITTPIAHANAPRPLGLRRPIGVSVLSSACKKRSGVCLPVTWSPSWGDRRESWSPENGACCFWQTWFRIDLSEETKIWWGRRIGCVNAILDLGFTI